MKFFLCIFLASALASLPAARAASAPVPFSVQVPQDLATGNSAALISDFRAAYNIPADSTVTYELVTSPIDSGAVDGVSIITPQAPALGCVVIIVVVTVIIWGVVICIIYHVCKSPSAPTPPPPIDTYTNVFIN